MLTQKDIDNLKLKIQNGETPTLFYVCDYQETRNNNSNNANYKTDHRYKVIEVKIRDIHNAYYEYLNFKEELDKANGDITKINGYHTEEDVEHYDYKMEHSVITKYIVKNSNKSYSKDLNPRIPTEIYGERLSSGNSEFITDTPITPHFTNKLEYGDLIGNAIIEQYNNKNLEWKYMHLENKEIVDGIEYEYLYTDWYYLETINFPTVEYPLINTTRRCSYFLTLEEAWEFVKECEA